MKKIKNFLAKFYYRNLYFLSRDNKKKSYYDFVNDGYTDLLFKDLWLNHNSVVFDIGGFKGEFTKGIQKLCPCNIYIFEPVKEYYELIVEKQKNNKKVHIYHFGLGGGAMNTKINITGSSSSVFTAPNNEECQEIKIESITEFITSNNVNKIDLMKINIEGGEYSLLESLISSHFIENIDILLIQFHDFVPDAIKLRNDIQNNLLLSHKKVFDYPFIWEKWVLV